MWVCVPPSYVLCKECFRSVINVMFGFLNLSFDFASDSTWARKSRNCDPDQTGLHSCQCKPSMMFLIHVLLNSALLKCWYCITSLTTRVQHSLLILSLHHELNQALAGGSNSVFLQTVSKCGLETVNFHGSI